MACDDRTGTAYHESGHAVAATVLGMRVDSITMDPPRTDFSMPRTTPPRDRMIVMLAGLNAEAVKMGRPKVLDNRNADILRAVATGNLDRLTHDEIEVCKQLSGLDPIGATRQLLDADQAARELVRVHWAEVEEIAEKLLNEHPVIMPAVAAQRRSQPVLRARWSLGLITSALAVGVVAIASAAPRETGSKAVRPTELSLSAVLAGRPNPCIGSKPIRALRSYGHVYVLCADQVTARP